jgi:hypothetical protein
MTNVKSITISSFLAGLFLLICTLTFHYFAVLKVDYRESCLLDLGHPDATECFAQVKALLKDGSPYLQIAYDNAPSEISLGCPVFDSYTQHSESVNLRAAPAS